jgi:hypothetical protein
LNFITWCQKFVMYIYVYIHVVTGNHVLLFVFSLRGSPWLLSNGFKSCFQLGIWLSRLSTWHLAFEALHLAFGFQGSPLGIWLSRLYTTVSSNEFISTRLYLPISTIKGWKFDTHLYLIKKSMTYWGSVGKVWRYSGTCLIWHTKRPGKCVWLYRMSEPV